ncbi:MAG TPA: 2'-5' RNA ligase family protein, partial [Sphingomicrobium sp.]
PPARVAGAAPLVVTATMGAADQRHFDALRAAHFPPDRNFLSAHIMLFHQLPPSAFGELDRLVRAVAGDTAAPAATIRDIYSLGRGTAFRIESPDLLAIRARIADHFHGMLTVQDQGTPRLHITVQNKVTPSEARALAAELAKDFSPRPLSIVGLSVHHYRGGPWDFAFTRNFRRGRT